MISPPLIAEQFAPLQHLPGGTTALTAAGDLTVGVHADGQPAGWPLLHDGRARHATLVGDAGSGKTELLRSVLLAARAAGVDAAVIDVQQDVLSGLGFPTAVTMTAARRVLAEQYELALFRQATGGGPLQLLVIENLSYLTGDAVIRDLIGLLAKEAGPARIAVLAGTQQVRWPVFGRRDSAEATWRLLAQELVLMRTSSQYIPSLPMLVAEPDELERVPVCFADGSHAAGVGYLPRRSATPFRAWRA